MVATGISELIQPILGSFVKKMRMLYGRQLHSIILYGSYARSDFNEESDVDLLLLLEKDKVNP